jgi:hypothetical protein
MLGSLAVSWLLCGPQFMRPEAYLTTAFVTASFSLAVPAYDYQEIAVLVALFCLFNACVGISSPSLARLRSIYVPNGMRAGLLLGAGCLHILNRWSCVANEDCPCKREQYQQNMRAASSQSICVQCGTKLDIGLGFDSASHSTKENAPALTPTHEGTCAIPNKQGY